MQLVQGRDKDDAVAALKKQFKLKKPITITPTGEVRVPGVTDNPDPPSGGPPAPPVPPAPIPPPEPKKGSQLGSESPAAESITEAVERLARRAERSEALQRVARYSRFQRLVNMRPREMREHFESSELATLLSSSRRSKTAAIREGREASRWIKRLKETPVEDWTPELWEWCDRVTRFIERLRKNGAPLLAEGGRVTRKLQALRSWGHDPLRESYVEAADARELLALPRATGLRLLDASSTDGPVQIVEAERAPALKVLKAGRTSLTSEEREKCMQAEAVWHNGPGNSAVCAVWKANVDGSIWYGSNTHRAYSASRTLAGAIKRFNDFVKTTS